MGARIVSRLTGGWEDEGEGVLGEWGVWRGD